MGAEDVCTGDIPKRYVKRRYYTFDEVQAHDKANDCWVSYFGNVYDLTMLLAVNKGHLAMPIIRAAGSDVSHWFDEKTRMPKTFIDPDTLCEEFNYPQGRYIHVPPMFPTTDFDDVADTPWWTEKGQYWVGKLTSAVRKIRIMNLLTKQSDEVQVPAEETLEEIQNRYLENNFHAKSYVWKRLGKPLDLQKTLEENGLTDETQEYLKLGMDPDDHIPTIHLYFLDDLTTG
eukprot:GEMP01075950.1.p1 GENE.GEMP01075950.1~~GEMP01075950.1.p1  ORF type:complete len:230 (+),score=46.82 GEMP01075950.1:46-735(+)